MKKKTPEIQRHIIVDTSTGEVVGSVPIPRKSPASILIALLLFLLLLIDAVFLIFVSNIPYSWAYAVYYVALLVQGFMFTSRGSIVSEKKQTISVIISSTGLVSFLFCSFFEHSWIMAGVAIISYFIFPGIGQTLTLMFSGRKYESSIIARVFTVIFCIAFSYVAILGRIVTM